LQIAKELVGKSDVVVENFAPGVMKKLGLDYASLTELNPKLIMASISGFGQFGPWADHTVRRTPSVSARSTMPLLLSASLRAKMATWCSRQLSTSGRTSPRRSANTRLSHHADQRRWEKTRW
jgi:hypothetical protein